VKESIMLFQSEISQLAQREKVLESEIANALRQNSADDPMVVHLKSRALYLRDEIERLREEFGRIH
jgi:hypothetical protein